ncbi:SDR family oxidoreductase [Ramlibacter sp. AW1]|uniref:SDR family oxidoreductase n=1 Tax=Ramlibacter aurantiacus TaxID=2801330 RepID=A0A936ZJ77_9BURK|nr:SDR family oxidoreductase [Ramlibacter aurantiacus]MBL0421902.1 SDR family oxidoreductase [Ramlibacter aurantiacus]
MKPVALVTGAGSGIGLAVAQRLCGDGWQVVGLARREQVLRERLPGGCDVLACDVADAGAVDRAMAQLLQSHGRLDAVVNCAGIVHRGLLQDQSLAHIDSQIDINLRGTIHVIRASIAALKATRGSIVNFSSTLGQHPVPGVSIYAATKGAIEALTRAMSIELAADGVRVNAISPALVRSEIWQAAGMSDGDYQALMAARAREYPLGRVGEPEDVSALVAFLLSPNAGWLTGLCIPVDGGSSVNLVRR